MKKIRQGDFLYYLGPDKQTKYDKYPNKEWFDLKSITKLFLLFVLIDQGIKPSDKIIKYFPDYPYSKITVKDIINHKSGLQNDWTGSSLQRKYFQSDDIYRFTLKLKMIPANYGKYIYNNYTYNILAAIIKKETGKHWNDLLTQIFTKAKFKIHKINGLPFASHSLFIRKKDVPSISKEILNRKYHDIIISKRLIPDTQKHYRKLVPGVIFSGHSGSGGQDVIFNNDDIFWALSYDNPDLHSRGLNDDEVKHYLLKFRKQHGGNCKTCSLKSPEECESDSLCAKNVVYGCICRDYTDYPPKSLGGGVLAVRKLAAKYLEDTGIIESPECYRTIWAPINVKHSKEMADVFDELKSLSYETNQSRYNAILKSYNALAHETVEQYKAARDAGYVIEPWLKEGQPYPNSEELLRDVRDNKHMWVFLTETGFGSSPGDPNNPLLQPTPFKYAIGQTQRRYLVNDLFRFVHDLFGHVRYGYSFGPRGEENAWRSHRCMFSKDAIPAMTAETRGQNSWVNFGPHLRRPDGSLPQAGDSDWISPEQRPFAPQKTVIMPYEFTEV